jgi:hypothetical protein
MRFANLVMYTRIGARACCDNLTSNHHAAHLQQYTR